MTKPTGRPRGRPKRLAEAPAPFLGQTPTTSLDTFEPVTGVAALNAAADAAVPDEDFSFRVPVKPWAPPEPLSPLGLYFNHLAGEGHRKVWSCLEHIQVIDSPNGTGKTTELLCEVVALFMNCHPTRKRTCPVRILVLAPSRPQLADIYTKRIIEDSELKFPEAFSPALRKIGRKPLLDFTAVRAKPNGAPDIGWTTGGGKRGLSVINHEDGSSIHFAISQEGSWKRIESNEFDAIFQDEAVGSMELGDTIRTRLRSSWDSTELTGGAFYKWYFTEQNADAAAIDIVKRAKRGDPLHAYLELSPQDNANAVSDKVRQEIGSTMTRGAAEVRMLGTRRMFDELLVFSRFQRDRHVLPEPYEPSPQANLWCAWDPGIRHPYGLVFFALEPEEPTRLIVWAASLETSTTIDHQANVIARILDGRFLTGMVYDPAAGPRREQSNGEKLWEIMDTALRKRSVKIRRGMEPGVNAYDITITLVNRYLEPDPERITPPLLVCAPPGPMNPGAEFFIDGMERLRWKHAGIHTLAREGIVCEDDEISSCTRYLVGMQIHWSDQGVNNRVGKGPMLVTGVPYAIPPPRDPLGDDPSLTPVQREQRAALRASRALIRENAKAQGHGKRRMPSIWNPRW